MQMQRGFSAQRGQHAKMHPKRLQVVSDMQRVERTMSGMATDTFHLPEGIRYECIQCGKSCRMFEEVFVEPASEQRLESIAHRHLMPEPVRDKSPLVPGRSDPEKKRLRWHCGECVFQHPSGLCGIHAEHDFETKPQTCQDFPYRFIQTPQGIFVGLSFACTSVLANEGPLVSNQGDYARRMFPRANGRRDCRGPVHLSARHDISWEAYQLIEEDLRRILAIESEPFSQRLVAQSVYLDLTEKLLRLARGERAARTEEHRFAADGGSLPDAGVVGAVRKRYLAQEGAPDLFRLARRTRSSPALQRAFLGLVTAFRQNIYEKDRRPTRFGSVFRIAGHYAAHASKAGRVNLIPLDGRFSYSEFSRLPFDTSQHAGMRELLWRYFDHSLFRKDLLMAESVWLAQRMTLMHFALIRWYSVGTAALESREAVELEDLREAIRNVELHYLFHTKFAELFEKFPLLGMILDGIVRRPAFAASMAGPTV